MPFVIHNVYHSCHCWWPTIDFIIFSNVMPYFSRVFSIFNSCRFDNILTFTNSFYRIILAANIVTIHINFQANQIRPKQHQSKKNQKHSWTHCYCVGNFMVCFFFFFLNILYNLRTKRWEVHLQCYTNFFIFICLFVLVRCCFNFWYGEFWRRFMCIRSVGVLLSESLKEIYKTKKKTILTSFFLLFSFFYILLLSNSNRIQNDIDICDAHRCGGCPNNSSLFVWRS